jgi:hypothetical protein
MDALFMYGVIRGYPGNHQIRLSLYTRAASFLGENGKWKEDLINQHFLQEDRELILKLKTSPRRENDFIPWHPEKSGEFSVRSA